MSYFQRVAATGDHWVGEEQHRNIVAADKGKAATAADVVVVVAAATAAAAVAPAGVDDAVGQGGCHTLC